MYMHGIQTVGNNVSYSIKIKVIILCVCIHTCNSQSWSMQYKSTIV